MASIKPLTALALLALAACSSSQKSAPAADSGDLPPGREQLFDPSRPEAGLTFLEQRLAELVEREQQLYERIEEDPTRLDDSQKHLRFDAIAREYESIIAQNPDALLPLLLYGKLLRRVGDRYHAQEIFEQVNALDPQVAVVKQQMGNFFAEENEPALALAYFLAAVDLEPEEPMYHFTLGEFLYTFTEPLVASGTVSRAVLERDMLAAFREAARLAPAETTYRFRYAETFYDLSSPDWEAALKAWEELQGEVQTRLEADAVRLHRARCLSELGRTAEARGLAEQVTSPGLRHTRDQLLARIEQPAS